MKGKFCIFITLIFCLTMTLSVAVQAETYHLGGTDMKLRVDDSAWYVFTRDNIKNNSELNKLEITYEEMYNTLYDNDAYLDAILIYETGDYIELFIRKNNVDTGITNLSNYDDDEVLELAKEIAENTDTDDYSIYKTQYKFTKTKYIDSDFYICEFATIVNKENYIITFQATSDFTNSEYEQIETIVDSVQFDVDTSLKENKTPSFLDSVIPKAIGGAVVGGVVGLIFAIINKNKKKKNNQNNESGYYYNN